jgi:hypothetical protein
MRWFRSSRRPWGWLALLTLVFQLGLSFGHIHGTRGPAAVETTTANAGNASNTGDSDADFCATCAILALLTGAQTANAPVFILPVARAAEIIVAPEAPRLGGSRTAFQSRAPPLS